MDIATCFIGQGASHQSVITHLGPSKFNEEKDHIICVCAIGYKSAYQLVFTRFMHWRDSSNRFGRLPLTQLLFHSDDNTNMTRLDESMLSQQPFARFFACFEACRWAPSSFNEQPTRCVVVTEQNRIKRLDFYASTTSRYYAAVALGIWLANFECGCDELGIKGYWKKVEKMKCDCDELGIKGYWKKVEKMKCDCDELGIK
eukprot:990414_1